MKKGSLSLSINAIVILIISIAVLLLGIGFLSGFFGKTDENLKELIGKEQDAPSPSASNSMTLSRERIVTSPGSTEIVKVAVMNPSKKQWVGRKDLYFNCAGCNQGDGVCFAGGGTKCKAVPYSDACYGTDFDCLGDDIAGDSCVSGDGVCYVGPGCDEGNEIEDADCGPRTEGIDLVISCGGSLVGGQYSNSKKVKPGEIAEFVSLIKVSEDASSAICSYRIYGYDEEGNNVDGIKKELTIEVQ